MIVLPTIGVGVVALWHGRLLLIRRGTEPGKGQWVVPGGRVEPGERLREAAAREAFEETGIEMSIGDVAWEGEVVAAGIPSPYRYAVIDFLATPAGDEAVAGSDAEEVRWVGLSELDELDLVPSMQGLLEALR